MPVSFETGDIFATPQFSAFAHGCNCAGAMGKGIAVSFKKEWPVMYQHYRQECKNGRFNPGDVLVWEEGDRVIFNLGTQKSWTTKAEFHWVATALGRMLEMAEQRGVTEIALPRIGAGLGGLDWPVVRSLLEELGSGSGIHLRVCETFLAGHALS